MAGSPSRVRSSGVNCRAHLLEGAAAADVGDGGVDVGVARLGLILQECRHRHNHAALAIAALRHVAVEPSFLHAVHDAVLRETFDGRDLLPDRVADLHATGARCYAVNVHGAGAALGDAAAVFGAGQADLFPQHPQQWGRGIDVDILGFSVDGETGHTLFLPTFPTCCYFRDLIVVG